MQPWNQVKRLLEKHAEARIKDLLLVGFEQVALAL